MKIYMATIASSHKLLQTDIAPSIAKGKREHASCAAIIRPVKHVRKGETGSTPQQNFLDASIVLRKHKGAFCHTTHMTPRRGNSYMVIEASNNTEEHLQSLDSYLGKLHHDVKQPSSKILKQRTEFIGRNDKLKSENGLRSLDNYHLKAKNDTEPENYGSKNLQVSLDTSAKKDQGSGRELPLNNYMDLKTEDAKSGHISTDNSSDFYFISVLASINIAVLLFEIATPVRNSDFELVSLPLLYGAKINNLILTGEWWRLVTPIFLHSGIFHIALGSWALFTFGLEVSREYGSFTFLLIYFLGGISGNLISFLHTPEPTVGGTGPVFAVIGAWLIYQVQNKDVISRDSSERMFQKAIIVTAISFVISNFTPIDDWAHFASAFIGIAYGYLTCPILQVKDASSETGQEEGLTLIRRYADPCKSLMYFSVFLLLLSSLLFIIEPPLDPIE